MPEGTTAAIEQVVEPDAFAPARRAAISTPLRAVEPCRRGLPIAEPLVAPVARRALVQLELLAEPDELDETTDELTEELVAFQCGTRPRFGGRMLAAAGLVAVVAPLSGFAVASSAANTAASAPEAAVLYFGDAPLADRGQPISRDEFRPAIAAAAQPEATVGTLSVQAVDKIIAPGQKAPDSVEQAMARAAAMTGNGGYDNMCLSLVAAFYGYTSAGEVGAQQAANTIIAAGQMHYDLSDIPVGALVFYDGSGIGNPYGHVAMYAGNGMVYSNGAPTGVGLIPLREPADGWRQPIIGWSSVWLPAATR